MSEVPYYVEPRYDGHYRGGVVEGAGGAATAPVAGVIRPGGASERFPPGHQGGAMTYAMAAAASPWGGETATVMSPPGAPPSQLGSGSRQHAYAGPHQAEDVIDFGRLNDCGDTRGG